jgi:hypothetical protein
MSAAPHVKAFCHDLAKTKKIWTIQFPDGSYIKWENEDGSEVFPVWSTESRVRKVLTYDEAFEGASAVFFSFEEFLSEWLPKLINDSVRLGPNWAGKNLSGWTFGAQELINRVKGAPGFHDNIT